LSAKIQIIKPKKAAKHYPHLSILLSQKNGQRFFLCPLIVKIFYSNSFLHFINYPLKNLLDRITFLLD